MYLSNNRGGRPTDALYEFKRAYADGRRRILAKERNPFLVIWQLHDCASSAPYNPAATLPRAELALELAESFDDPDLLSWAHAELGKVHRLLEKFKAAESHLDEAVRLAVSP